MKKSLLDGIGWSTSKALLTTACIALSTNSYGQEVDFDSSSEWIEATTWPYSVEIEPNKEPILVVIEQRGLDLAITRQGQISSNSPLGRNGPEFVFLPANTASSLSLDLISSYTPGGEFRVHEINLSTSQSQDMAGSLDEAGIEYGARTQAKILAACARYENLALNADLDSDWRWLASLMVVQCNLKGGVQNSDEQLNRLVDSSIDRGELFSLYPYVANWLLARQYYVLQSYELAELEFKKALEASLTVRLNESVSDSFLRLDAAEISSQYGDNGMMHSWKLSDHRSAQILEEAKSRVEFAISVASELKNSEILGNAYSNMAGVLFVQGDNVTPIEYMELAESHLEIAGDITGQNSVLGNMGDYYRRWGQLRQAQQAYNKATDNISDISDVGNHGILYQKLGNLDLLFLDYESALKNTLDAISYHSIEGRERSKYESISQLATIYREQGQLEEALNSRLQALNYFDSNGWTAPLLNTQAEYSRDLHIQGQVDAAFKVSELVLNRVLENNLVTGVDRIVVFNNHAQILYDLGRVKEAIALIEFGLREVETKGAEPIDEISLLATLLDLHQKLGATENAVSTAEAVFNLIESQRVEFDTVRLGPMWSARTAKIFNSHIEYLLQGENPDYIERAFTVSERARAASLRQRRQEMMLSMTEGNPAARAEWIEIYTKLQEAKSGYADEESLLKFERELNDARQKYFAAHGVSDYWVQPSLLGSNELLSKLPNNTDFVQFVAGAENLWRFTSSKGELRVTDLGNKNTISEAINTAAQNILDINNGERTGLVNLSRLLLDGIELEPETTSLLISSPSMLDAIPFSALFLEGRYLVDIVSTTMVPSLSEYFSTVHVKNDDTRLEIAVLADPAFEGSDVENYSTSEFRRFREWSDERQRLPYSAIEAQELARYFDIDKRLILTDSLATERQLFSEEVRNARILHIATHGYFNEDTPELVGISLAKEQEDDDGFVSLAEISTHRFSSELVVISACDSARGAEVPGEGTMSLSRSFLAQGVNSVVSTLWPISDAATALFMKEFYHGIRDRNLSAASALQSAQKSLKQHPRYRDPFYWGAYVLTSLSAQLPAS